MDFVEKQRTLLYKEEYNSWITRHEKAGRFARKDIDLTKSKLIHAAKGEQNYDGRLFAFGIDGSFGSLDYRVNISELELFRFTNSNDGNVTTFTLSLEDSNLDCLSQNGGDEFDESEASLSSRYSHVYVCEVIQGSMRGTQFFAYSEYGHVFLMDWATKRGKIVDKWPVYTDAEGNDPCDPYITAAISADGQLVAVIGSTLYYDYDADVGHDDDGYYNVIRLFNVSSEQYSVKKLKLNWQPVMVADNTTAMTFNPFHNNLLYLVYGSIELPYSTILVAYDTVQQKMLSRRDNVHLMMSHHARTYNNIDSPVFVRHGEMIIAYHDCSENPSRSDFILFLDAFTLDTVAIVKILPSDNIVSHFILVSTCQTQIAVFAINDSAHQVEVYKIPTYSVFSLQYLCKQTILGSVGCLDKVARLTMVPPILRDYLTLPH